MKRKNLLATAMAASLCILTLAGCGGSAEIQDQGASSGASAQATESASTAAEAAPESSGETESSVAIQPDATVLKISCGLAEGTPMVVGSQAFEEKLEELTDGRFDVQVFPNAELGDDTRVTEATSMGTLEMCATTSSVFSGICPQIGLFDLPFLFTSTEGADEVCDGEIGQTINQVIEENSGVHVLCYYENGFRCITNSKREIVTPADIAGLKIRTPESDVFLATFNQLGANPTPMAFSEVFTALQQGTIDGQENPLNTIYLNKFNEVQDYVTRTGHIYGVHMLIVNKDLYNGLSDEDRAAFDEAAAYASKVNRDLSREMDEDYARMLSEAGMKVTELTGEQKAEWQEACAPVYDQFKDAVGEELIQKAQDIMAKYN